MSGAIPKLIRGVVAAARRLDADATLAEIVARRRELAELEALAEFLAHRRGSKPSAVSDQSSGPRGQPAASQGTPLKRALIEHLADGSIQKPAVLAVTVGAACAEVTRQLMADQETFCFVRANGREGWALRAKRGRLAEEEEKDE